MAGINMVHLDASAVGWIGVSVLAVAMGFFVVHPHANQAPAPISEPEPSPAAATTLPTEVAAPISPQARAAQLLQGVKLISDPSANPTSQLDTRSFNSPARVAIFVQYDHAQQGDSMDASLSWGANSARCATNTFRYWPSGNAWCQFTNLQPGDYAFHLSINGVALGDYPFHVSPSVPDAASDAASEPTATQQSRSQKLIESYFTTWSTIANSNLDDLSVFYADDINFYGSSRSLSSVMAEKRRFALRWPTRAYTIHPGSLSSNCADVHDCLVTGIVDWIGSNPERGLHSSGSASFAFRLRDGLIVQETGTVLSRR